MDISRSLKAVAYLFRNYRSPAPAFHQGGHDVGFQRIIPADKGFCLLWPLLRLIPQRPGASSSRSLSCRPLPPPPRPSSRRWPFWRRSCPKVYTLPHPAWPTPGRKTTLGPWWKKGGLEEVGLRKINRPSALWTLTRTQRKMLRAEERGPREKKCVSRRRFSR